MKLLNRLLGRSNRAPLYRIPEGKRLYAIGDIHGRSDLLSQMADLIREDLDTFPVPHATTVFLGDYVDRGADSSGVLERLVRQDFPTNIIPLRGNHEMMLLTFMADPHAADDWRHAGGLETLHSYGVDVREVRAGRGYEAAAEALRAVLPPLHLEFLQETRLWFMEGDYFFCHAGVRPRVALVSQQPQDLLWIRQPFLDFKGSYEKLIVHGHTPVLEPEVRKNRVNIDTGAYISGRLTCLALENEAQRFLRTGKGHRLHWKTNHADLET